MSYKSVIKANTKLINQLHQKTRDAWADRNNGGEARQIWIESCHEFRERYSLLAFPKGETSARERLRAGDSEAINYALDFLEIRPYFFRSGFMYKDFMRVLRNCDLNATQRKRYQIIRERYLKYRATRKSHA